MRRRIRTGLLAAFVLAAAGCGTSPTERWITAAGTFEYGVKGALAAHTAGLLEDDDLRRLDPVVEGANFALDASYERLPEGGSVFDQAMDTVEAAIVQLERAAAREDDR